MLKAFRNSDVATIFDVEPGIINGSLLVFSIHCQDRCGKGHHCSSSPSCQRMCVPFPRSKSFYQGASGNANVWFILFNVILKHTIMC